MLNPTTWLWLLVGVAILIWAGRLSGWLSPSGHMALAGAIVIFFAADSLAEFAADAWRECRRAEREGRR